MTRQKKYWRISGLVVLAALLVFGPATVSAHTIAVGTLNAGLPGSVTIWLGSYHNGAPNEGSLTLTGANPPCSDP